MREPLACEQGIGRGDFTCKSLLAKNRTIYAEKFSDQGHVLECKKLKVHALESHQMEGTTSRSVQV